MSIIEKNKLTRSRTLFLSLSFNRNEAEIRKSIFFQAAADETPTAPLLSGVNF
jgi:hypothetical protein